MKYMVSWRVHEDKRHETLKVFAQMTADDDKKELGKDVKLIGRWHDLVQFQGVAIAETDKPDALAAWLLNWNHVIDIEAVPVFDDEECRAVGRKKLLS